MGEGKGLGLNGGGYCLGRMGDGMDTNEKN